MKCANWRDILPLGAARTRTALTRYGQQCRQPGVCVKFVQYAFDLISPSAAAARRWSYPARQCAKPAQDDLANIGEYKRLACHGPRGVAQ